MIVQWFEFELLVQQQERSNRPRKKERRILRSNKVKKLKKRTLIH